MPELKMELQQSQLKSHGDPSVSGHEAFVVGLYGVPGSGKSFLLNQLKRELGSTQSGFYEGSDIIASITPGGLDIFQSMEEQEQVHWRRRAIDTIRQDCIESGLTAVVVGHFMFWSNEQGEARPVYTEKDLYIFTHVLYLDVPAEVVEQRRLQDVGRNRPPLSATHLHKWQCEEKTQLRDLCRRHNILFMLVTPHPTLSTKISILLHDFRDHTEKYNLSQAKSRLDDIIGTSRDQLETVLVVDADGTLAAEDTGALFWKNVSKSPALEDRISPLKALYGSQLGYSYTAFRQAVLLYEETADDQEFDALCEDVALAVTMHPEFLSLLQLVVEQKHVGAVVITCGLCRVWEKVLQREGLSKKVKVIGGGRIADGFVVSAAVKAALVARLRETYHIYVWAFGDSPLDLDMLYMANRAVVVAGKEQTRSKTMNAALTHAIDHGGLRAHQAVLPSNASPRLDTTKLPVVKLTERDFVESLLRGRYTDDGLHVLCGTDKNAAKLLATSMRDAAIGGPVPAASASPCRMHVLGHQTKGFQLFHEHQTTIVALMRGGEPMASGVNDAFPLAMFVHASDVNDLKLHHVQGQLTVILADSVINTGKKIVEFVRRIRILHATIRIVIVAGVVQARCISEGGLKQTLARYAKVHLVALRLSDTKFTGSGTTDTGNRLFNTTHLP